MSGEVIQLDDHRNTHGKGALYDAAVEMGELDPIVQEEIDARESLIERICGINPKDFFVFDPAKRSKILMMRRDPEEFIDMESQSMMERVANDNKAPSNVPNVISTETVKQAA